MPLWWSGNGFMDKVVSSQVMLPNGKSKDICLEIVIRNEVSKIKEVKWFSDLARNVPLRGGMFDEHIGGNKLRTYRKFKNDVIFEPYLSHIQNDRKRVLFTKFRIGIAPLRIETGRYESDNKSSKQKGVPVHQRICWCCALGVEDELHFLLKCPSYSIERERMFMNCALHLTIKPIEYNKTAALQERLFVQLMQSTNPIIINSVATYIWNAFEIRERELRRNGKW